MSRSRAKSNGARSSPRRSDIRVARTTKRAPLHRPVLPAGCERYRAGTVAVTPLETTAMLSFGLAPGLGGTSWNSYVLTPLSRGVNVTLPGEQRRSAQNDATQPGARFCAVSVTAWPPFATTIKRYLYVELTLPGRSAPVHLVTEMARFDPCFTATATVPSAARSDTRSLISAAGLFGSTMSA